MARPYEQSHENVGERGVGANTIESGGNNTIMQQLTEEEKAVLMECRRNSTARGMCVLHAILA